MYILYIDMNFWGTVAVSQTIHGTELVRYVSIEISLRPIYEPVVSIMYHV